MKKQYDELTKHLRMVILIIAVLAISLFTVIKTDEMNDYYMVKRVDIFKRITKLRIEDCSSEDTTETRFRRYYDGTFHETPLEYLVYLKNDEMIYGDVYYEDQKGRGKIELTDYALIIGSEGYSRKWIIPLDSHATMLYNYLKNIEYNAFGEVDNLYEIDAISDGIFLREGSLKFLENLDECIEIEIPILDQESVTGELINIKEDGEFRIFIYDLPISAEAKHIQEKVLSKETLPRIKKGIFTSYFVFEEDLSDKESEKFQIHLTVVYHPFQMVLKENKETYIVMILVTICLLIFVKRIRKMWYRKMKSEERVAHIITGKMAYALKDPMISLNESVSDWMNAQEENRDEYVGKIITKVDQMDKTIMRLLKQKDVDSKDLNVEFEEVDLYELALEVQSIFKPILQKRNIKTSVKANHPEKCMVKADPEWMKFIIENLFAKAMDTVIEEFSVLITTGVYEEVEFELECLGAELYKDREKKIWKDSYVAEPTVMKELGIIGGGLDFVGRVLKAHKATYGCIVLPNRNAFMLWFRMKGTS